MLRVFFELSNLVGFDYCCGGLCCRPSASHCSAANAARPPPRGTLGRSRCGLQALRPSCCSRRPWDGFCLAPAAKRDHAQEISQTRCVFLFARSSGLGGCMAHTSKRAEMHGAYSGITSAPTTLEAGQVPSPMRLCSDCPDSGHKP